MDFKPASESSFKPKYVIFAIILIKVTLLATILIFCLKPFSIRTVFKNTQSMFWPAYSVPNHSNNIELLANIRLHQLQNAQNKENIQLVTSTMELIPGTMEAVKRKTNWKDKLASTISSTEASLKTMINIVDFAELLDESSSVWSLLPPSTADVYNAHKSVMSEEAIYPADNTKNEKWLQEYYHLKSSNFNYLN